VYQNAEDGIPNWEEINNDRFAMLETQLDIYARVKASWSIWLYKGERPIAFPPIRSQHSCTCMYWTRADIGFQGMTYVGEDTPYIKLLKPFLLKKKVRTAVKAYLDSPPLTQTSRSDSRPTLGA
jgi:hypothetical protein